MNTSSNEFVVGFEFKFQSFIENQIDTQKNSRISTYFWTELNSIILAKLTNQKQNSEGQEQKKLDSASTQANFLTSFCSVFQVYWAKPSKSTSINSIVQSLFSFYMINFKINQEAMNDELTIIYLECLNKLAKNFLDEHMLSWFVPDSSVAVDKLSEFNEKFLKSLFQTYTARKLRNFDAEHNLIFVLVELYLLVNDGKADLFEKLNEYLFSEKTVDITSVHTEFFLKTFLNKCNSKQIDSKMRAYLTEFIIKSDPLKSILLAHILSEKRLFVSESVAKYKNHEMAFDILQELIKHEPSSLKKDSSIKFLFDSYMAKSIRFLENFNTNFKTIESDNGECLSHLNNYLLFNTSLIFKFEKSYLLKLVDLSRLWSILINNLQLKENLRLHLSKMGDERIETNLNELMNSIACIMIDEYLIEKIDYASAFVELTQLVRGYLSRNELIVSDLISDLIVHFEFALKKSKKVNESSANLWLDKFYQNVLLDFRHQYDSYQVSKT